MCLLLIGVSKHAPVHVGYALGEDGMLFRGELVVGCDEKEAWQHAKGLANYFAELDAEDSGEH